MANKINPHVERLNRYLPFSPSHDQIYEEYQRTDDALDLETKALDYLVKAISSGAKLVILTGDAGHGKTHLCRRLLEVHFGFNQEQAREMIVNKCDGQETITVKGGCLPLRIYKDFSEMTIDVASDRIQRALSGKGESTIICANEGRLRAVLEHGKSNELLERFSDSFSDGLASIDGEIHIVNLNYQSVASDQHPSLVSRAIKSWVSGNHWKICKNCESLAGCPIYFNRFQFSSGGSKKALERLERTDLLFSAVERLGVVVTIREILMTIAYLLTGGLTCEQVHKKLSHRKNGWQHEYVYYNTLFQPPKKLNRDKLRKIPILGDFSQLDPGDRSIGTVDETIINEQEVFDQNSLDLLFNYRSGSSTSIVDASNGIDEIIGNPRNNKERLNEASFIRSIVRSLRRKFYFDGDGNDTMSRLGFEYGDEFLESLNDKITATRMKIVKNMIVSGLHTIQGLQMSTKETTLHVVDSSFSNTGGRTAIIARRISTTAIKILSMRAAWNIDQKSRAYEISSSVDWLDRQIVLRVENEGNAPLDFPVNLMVFDCIARSSSGYVAEEFYAHDLKRIRTFLGRLAKHQDPTGGDISLFLHGKMHSVSIDNGVIQVGGGR